MYRRLDFLFLILIFTISNHFYTQNNDCNTAYYFQDSLGEIFKPKGSGKSQEIKGYSIKNEFFFTKEHNTAWCIISFTQDANFQFELTPQFPNDDFDFVILTYHGSTTCDSITKNSITPIRSNLSKRMPDNGSKTGLKTGFENNFSAAGPNPSYSSPLSVSKGDSILVIFDSPYGSKGGFTIKNNTEYFPEVVIDTVPEVIEPEVKRVTMVVLDTAGNPIKEPSIFLKSLGKIHRDNQQIDAEGNVYSEFFKPGVEQLVIASQKGYLYQKFNFKWNGENDSTIYLQLTPLKAGTKLQLENILFISNSPQIESRSKDELQDLLAFLKNNPTMEIEIGGHVHATSRRNKKKYRKLSEERALTIYTFAISNGIDPERLIYKGYGNSQMLHRPAKNESEIAANRRVEFTIIRVR